MKRLATLPRPHLTLKQVRLLRLYTLLLVLSVLVLYAVFRSLRFQEIMRRKTERILTEATGRPVAIGGFDLALVPPAFLVRDVAIANDPRGVPGPALAVAEVELRGIPTVTATRIDLPKVRLVSPRVVFEVFADGTNNFSTLLDRLPKSDGKGKDLRLGEAVIQKGTIRFREWSSRLDCVLRDVGLVARSSPFSRVTSLSLAARSLSFRLEENKVLEAMFGVDVLLSPGRVRLTRVALDSDDLSIHVRGGVEDLQHPALALSGQVDFAAEALNTYFGVEVPLGGRVVTKAFARIPFGRGYDVRARFDIPDGSFGPFPISGSGTLHIGDGGLLVKADRVRAFDGQIGVLVDLPRLKGPPLPVRLVLDGRGLDLEDFLGRLGVTGTGLRTRADLAATLSFGRGGIGKADGAASLVLHPDVLSKSLVAGRNAIPASGGGTLWVRAGKIVFPGYPLVTSGGARLKLDGTVSFDGWTPDLAFDLEADDLAEVERLAENFYPALQGGRRLSPPLKVGGSGRVTGRFERAFSDPRISGNLEAREFVLRGQRFGRTSADFVVDRNVLDLGRFLARDAGGTLAVSGLLAFGAAAPVPGQYRLRKFVVDASAWPVERLLGFLDFDLPIEGLVTGRLPLDGVTPGVAGGGRVVWEHGRLWGHPVDRLDGELLFEHEGLRLRAAQAVLGQGCLSGSGAWEYDGRFSFEARAEGVRLSSLFAGEGTLPGAEAALTGRVHGEGTLERPRIGVDLSVADASWKGRRVGIEGGEARLTLDADGHFVNGALSLGNAWSVRVASRRTGAEPGAVETRVELRVPRVDILAAALGVPPEARMEGVFDADAVVHLDPSTGDFRSLDGKVRRADLKVAGKRLRGATGAAFSYRDGAAAFEGLRLEDAPDAGGEAPPSQMRSNLALSGKVSFGDSPALDMRILGALDASFLAPFVPGGGELTGPVAVDLAIAGSPDSPSVRGTVRFQGVDYGSRGSVTPVEGIVGTISFLPGRLLTNDLSFRWDSDVSVAGSVGLDGLSPTSIRANVKVSQLRVEPFHGFRTSLSGDLVVSGDTDVRRVAGELTFDSAVYAQDFEVSLASLLGKFGGGGGPRAAAPGRFDQVELRLRLVAPPGRIEIRNNVARFRAQGDAVLRGTLGRPLLFGQFEAEEGGRMTLRGQRYDLTTAKLIFANPLRIDPYFEVTARANIRDWLVDVSLSGTATKIVPRFSSEPPLTEAEIISLVTSGDLPSRGPGGAPVPVGPTVSSDEAIAKAARELIASLATDAATRGTKELLKLDRLQLDPVFVGSAFDAPRLTIGKQISKDISLTYSYTASSNQQQLIVVDYQITPSTFLQFVRDEYGVYSVDVKLRQRLR